MKQTIRLTESDLHRIIKESVNRLLNEIGGTSKGQRVLGALQARTEKRNNKASSSIYNYAKNARSGDNEDSLLGDYFKGYHDYVTSHPTQKLTDPKLCAQVKDVFIKALAEQQPTFTKGGDMQFECDGYEFEVDNIDYDVDFTRGEGDVYPCMYFNKGDFYMYVSFNDGDWMRMLLDTEMKNAIDKYCSMDEEDMQEVLDEAEPDW